MTEKKQISSFRIVAVLAVICAVISLLVAGVYSITKDRIAKNTEIKTENALKAIFPVYSSKASLESDDFDESINAVYKIEDEGGIIGYAIDATVKGYGSDGINLMIGVSGEKVTSVVVISASGETPGLGQKVTESRYLERFTGISLGEKADAITGATISSKAVQSGVDTALDTVKMIMSGEITFKEAQ